MAEAVNLADGLTKVLGNSALSTLMSSERDDTAVAQWIKLADSQPTNFGKVAGV